MNLRRLTKLFSRQELRSDLPCDPYGHISDPRESSHLINQMLTSRQLREVVTINYNPERSGLTAKAGALIEVVARPIIPNSHNLSTNDPPAQAKVRAMS